MSTQKQIDANRANSLKSTGPRGDEGKNKVRFNAKRDGITGQVITLSDEDRPVFEKLKAELIADLAPKTVMELRLANSIAWDTWRLDHLRAVEMNMYALGAADSDVDVDSDHPELHTAMSGAVTFEKESPKFALMSIYEQRMNRSLHKNLATLRDLQAVRKRDYEHDLRQEITIAEANDIKGLPYKAPAGRSRNGFEFSTREVELASNRVNRFAEAFLTVGRAPVKVRFAAGDDFDPTGPNSGLKVATAA